MSFSNYAQVVTNADWGASITDNSYPSGAVWTYEASSPYSNGSTTFAYAIQFAPTFIGPGSFNNNIVSGNLPSGFSATVIAFYMGEDYMQNYVNTNNSASSAPPPLIGPNAFTTCSNLVTINIPSLPNTLRHQNGVFGDGGFPDLPTNNSATVTELPFPVSGTIYYTIYDYFYNNAKSGQQGPGQPAQGYGTTIDYIPGGPPPPYPCFKEGTKIQTKNGYVPIETLRKGDLVNTLKNGFVPVNMIGHRVLKNSICEERIKDKLYTYTAAEHSEIFEDLVITGCHSILVDKFKEGQREETEKVLGDIYITDNKYRLPACVDTDAKPYEVEGDITIWHIALDNDDYLMNYGIYANGLLVESTSQRYLKELSGMTILM